MKKIIIATLALCLLIASFIIIKKIKQPTTPPAYTIGILQTASHPALDAARDGFITELTHLIPDQIEFVINNAQGSIPQAHTIAQQFHANKQFNAFFAIATPAAQALAAVEKERPIIIAAVTDPHGLGLMHAKTNVCGTQDMIDTKAALRLLRALVPEAKTVGLLYTTGEVNARAAATMMRTELEKELLTVIDCSTSGELEIASLVESACRKVDLLFAPNDNTIASSIQLIASIAQRNTVPLFVSDPMLVPSGPLAACGINYTDSGAHAARITQEVLIQRKKPYNLPITPSPSTVIVINKKTLDALGLTLPASLTDAVTLIS